MAQGMQGITSGGLGSLTKATISAARKAAQADRVKAVKTKLKITVSIKKKNKNAD